MKTKLNIQALAIALICFQVFGGEVVVIGNNNVPKMDIETIQKIYTGKYIAVSGVSVIPVGSKPGSAERNRFLQEFLNQDEEKYTAYWTVRRYIGKGTPPAELASASEVINYVQATPGAVGYIDAVALEQKQGVNILARK